MMTTNLFVIVNVKQLKPR